MHVPQADAALIRSGTIRQVMSTGADLAFAALFRAARMFQARPTMRSRARIVILGGGTAGITVAARLTHTMAQPDITIVEPSTQHIYQPGQTLVGGGVLARRDIVRSEQRYIPPGVTWRRDTVLEIDPEVQSLGTQSGQRVAYDYLVVAPGLTLYYDRIPGLGDRLGQDGICSIYTLEQAEKTWHMLQNFHRGTALFTMPSTPIKCGGAPQKIMYLTEDYLRRCGRRDGAEMLFASPSDNIFGIPAYANTLSQLARQRQIKHHFQHRLVEVQPEKKRAVFTVTTQKQVGADLVSEDSQAIIPYDLLHIVPPMSAPEVVQHSALAHPDGPNQGWLNVDRHTLQHPVYANVFGLGDVIGVPSTKTGAAVRKQAPVVVQNLVATLQGKDPATSLARYHGYTSCPLITGYGRVMLAEFDYDFQPFSSFHLDPTVPRYSMWLLKVYGLPALYWHGMLRGLA